MTNAERCAAQIARLIANSLESICVQFATCTDNYGEFDCGSCQLNKICNNAEKLEEWLREEAPNETRS